MRRTLGNSAETMLADPSTDPLSTTITSQRPLSTSSLRLRRQFRRSSHVFQFTITMESSGALMLEESIASERISLHWQVPAVPAVHVSGQLGHLGPGAFPFSSRNSARSPMSINGLA